MLSLWLEKFGEEKFSREEAASFIENMREKAAQWTSEPEKTLTVQRRGRRPKTSLEPKKVMDETNKIKRELEALDIM